MTTNLFLSRARLRAERGEALASIAPILLPADDDRRVGHAHRLVWMLFQDGPDELRFGHSAADASRDFLWRDDSGGKFMLLSQRPPTDPHGLFDLDTKPFEPNFRSGDLLRFTLRVNPVIARKGALSVEQRKQRTRGKRVDVVMDALSRIPLTDWDARTGRAFERDRLAAETVEAWLAAQGAGHGFTSTGIRVESYTQVAVERRKGRPAGIAIVDVSGSLTVTDPPAFLAKLARGFGSAKAFGCGLMLVRRA